MSIALVRWEKAGTSLCQGQHRGGKRPTRILYCGRAAVNPSFPPSHFPRIQQTRRWELVSVNRSLPMAAPTKRGEVAPSPTLSPGKTRNAARGHTAPGGASPPPAPQQSSRKKRKVSSAGDAAAEVAVSRESDAAKSEKAVVIEACKQCQCFRRSALKVKEDLEKHISGIDVVINPEKPRRGYFEVRDANSSDIFITLPDMKRPFKPLKSLDLAALVTDIVQNLK